MFPDERLRLILGGPGCGKTTRLLSIVEQEMSAGVGPSEIAFVTFTRAAAEEAKTRAAALFRLDPKIDLPWFRTIHSLAYTALGMTRDDLMGPKDWARFSGAMRVPLTRSYVGDEIEYEGEVKCAGDTMLRVIEYGTATGLTLAGAQRALNIRMDPWRLQQFADSLIAYKAQFDKMTFSDMLTLYNRNAPALKVKVAVIDEAQDLTKGQWRVVEHAFGDAERVYVGGDDDQAIYRWAGADVEHFLALGGQHEILPHSHRLAPEVLAVATKIVTRIRHRYEKQFTPGTHIGTIARYRALEQVPVGEDGTWMLLARNSYVLQSYITFCEQQGLPYRTRSGPAIVPMTVRDIEAWERMRSGGEGSAEEGRGIAKLLGRPKPTLRESDRYTRGDFLAWPWDRPWEEAFTKLPRRVRTYYAAVIRRKGIRIATPPNILLETIHGVKGAEADHVLVSQDVARASLTGGDDEHRVFYVGVTRARRSLHILAPQTSQSYRIE